VDDEKRAALITAMEQDPIGRRWLDRLAETWVAYDMKLEATSPEARIAASMNALKSTLALASETGAFEEIRRQIVSQVNGQQMNVGTDTNTVRIFQKKHASTEAGLRQIRAALERFLLILGPPVIGEGATNVVTAHPIFAESGYHGTLGAGDKLGKFFETTKIRGVDPSKGADFAFRLLAMAHAGYHFGSRGIETPPHEIAVPEWVRATFRSKVPAPTPPCWR
jgi:hypothetical protein